MAATGWPDGAATHLACAMATGLASTAATNPVDVVKTHMFMATAGKAAGGSGGGSGGGGGERSGARMGPLQCARALAAEHGAAAFARGFLANYARLGPQTVVTFLVAEQLRRLAGLQAL